MSRRAIALGTLFVVGFLTSTPLRGADEGNDSPYYPLKIGSRWTYRVNEGDKRISTHIGKHEKVGDTLCAVIEAAVDGKVAATEYVAIDKDGVSRYKFNTETLKTPVRFLALPPKDGETWKFETEFGVEKVKGSATAGSADVEVKAGKYKTITTKMEIESNDQKISIESWYAEGVGMVKQVMKIGPVEIRLDLEKFEPAGK